MASATEAKQGAAEAGPEGERHILLPAALDYAAAEDLHAELLAARTAPVVVLDAAGVTTMSTTAVLVILSFLKGRADLSPPAVVRDPAGPFVDAFSQLGLFSSLMRMEFRT